MRYSLPELPYAYDSLEPFIDTETMKIHHMKHHQAYIDKLNAALEKYTESEISVEDMLSDLNSVPEDIRVIVRNHGGGFVNHSLFWQILTPHPSEKKFVGEIAETIDYIFGGFDKFKNKMIEAGMNRFGSGWVWLVLSNGQLEILSTPNQDSPLMEKKIPLLGIDVWEHAYYLKWKSDRKGYLNEIWNVINWKKINEIFVSVLK